mgnify:FL=1|tara:strand:+ start:14342 stop:15097 length:756 start_codon:yes stop_codon:yes gene_type:complete
MFFLKRFCAPKPTFSAELAPDEPFFAIGDIHGRDDLLKRILMRMDEVAPDIRRVFVGDYIDRGEHSAGLLRRLQALEQSCDGQVVCLKGNHEDMLLRFLDNPAEAGPAWMRHGGLQTMASFLIAPPSSSAPSQEWETARDKLREGMGGPLISWLEDLPTSWQTGNVAVVHAGADPTVPLEEQYDNILLWGHAEFATTLRTDGVWVVHGHTIIDAPMVCNGRISIDTGAYATGLLTALYLRPGRDEPEFLQA